MVGAIDAVQDGGGGLKYLVGVPYRKVRGIRQHDCKYHTADRFNQQTLKLKLTRIHNPRLNR